MKAIQWCEKNQNKTFLYTENNHSAPGVFEVLEDMNCCAPTQDVLFSFTMEHSRKIMDAPALLEFIRHVQEAKEKGSSNQ